jgi:hypothetical protein
MVAFISGKDDIKCVEHFVCTLRGFLVSYTQIYSISRELSFHNHKDDDKHNQIMFRNHKTGNK